MLKIIQCTYIWKFCAALAESWQIWWNKQSEHWCITFILDTHNQDFIKNKDSKYINEINLF